MTAYHTRPNTTSTSDGGAACDLASPGMAETDPPGAPDVVIEDAPDLYVPACPVCQQPGRERATAASGQRYFICAFCGARWVVMRSDHP